MKIYHSFDVKSQQARIEPNKVDEYCIHLEDYEDINTLIERSIRTKTAFIPEHRPDAEYDDCFDELAEENDLSEDSDGENEQAAAEQSEAAASSAEPELSLTQ